MFGKKQLPQPHTDTFHIIEKDLDALYEEIEQKESPVYQQAMNIMQEQSEHVQPTLTPQITPFSDPKMVYVERKILLPDGRLVPCDVNGRPLG